jgi:hypothetical protein
MSPHEFVAHFPYLYHMAHKQAWEGITRHGLLSTSALLDLFEVQGEQRFAIESQHRPEPILIEHPAHGTAIVRDQKPMSESALQKCLQGLSPQQWYEILNRKVFFWLNADRLARLLSARAYRDDAHCVITVDAALLLGRHLVQVRLSPINSGSTIFNPQPRGEDTFLPLDEYPFDAWARRRGSREAVAELAVEYHVPDLEELVVRADIRRADQVLEVLYER